MKEFKTASKPKKRIEEMTYEEKKSRVSSSSKSPSLPSFMKRRGRSREFETARQARDLEKKGVVSHLRTTCDASMTVENPVGTPMVSSFEDMLRKSKRKVFGVRKPVGFLNKIKVNKKVKAIKKRHKVNKGRKRPSGKDHLNNLKGYLLKRKGEFRRMIKDFGSTNIYDLTSHKVKKGIEVKSVR